jgi:hypothetical protein
MLLRSKQFRATTRSRRGPTDLSQRPDAQSFRAHATLPISLRVLKQFAVEKLPKDWPLREVLVTEEDEIGAIEFLAKARVWLVLLRHGQGGRGD